MTQKEAIELWNETSIPPKECTGFKFAYLRLKYDDAPESVNNRFYIANKLREWADAMEGKT